MANKELLEARYWLALIDEAELGAAAVVRPLVAEATELIAILAASIRTAKYRSAPQPRR